MRVYRTVAIALIVTLSFTGCVFPDLTAAQQTSAASAVYGKISSSTLGTLMLIETLTPANDLDSRTGYLRIEYGGETTIIDHHLTNVYSGSYAGWGATIDGVSYTGAGSFTADNSSGTWTYGATFNFTGAGPVQKVVFSNATISGSTVASGSVVVNGVGISGW